VHAGCAVWTVLSARVALGVGWLAGVLVWLVKQWLVKPSLSLDAGWLVGLLVVGDLTTEI
jgi:hypothetical protein